MKRQSSPLLLTTQRRAQYALLILTLVFSVRHWCSSCSTFFNLQSQAASVLLLAKAASSTNVVELTDSTFEHQTQSSTGQTTGKWFIMFYAPWCGHCKRLQPTWEELATKLSNDDEYKNEGIVIGKIDMTISPMTQRRFDIQGFPTLLYFANRRMYTYNGKRDIESFINFVMGEYQTTNDDTGEKVPPPSSWIEEQISNFRQNFLNDAPKGMSNLVSDLDHILKIRKNAALAIALLGVFIGFFFGFLFGGSYAASTNKKLMLMEKSRKQSSNISPTSNTKDNETTLEKKEK